MSRARCLPRSAVLVALVALAQGCGDAGAGGGAAGGAASGAGGAGGGGAAAILDPALFDCTRSADPERVTPVAPSCATDPGCTEKLVSGHRGAPNLAPEDSVAGVRAAIALGIDFVETDPRPTKDGHLVNVHDTSVDRTTDGSGEVADLTLAEVQALKLDTFGLPGDFSCEHVPTLEEILTAARGKVHVLVDANKTDRVDLLVAAIQSTDALEWAIFDTSSVDKIDQALALEPALLTMIRVDDETQLADQLAHFAAHPPVIVEIQAATPAMLGAVHDAGQRALLDLFPIDIAAGIGDDFSAYGPVFEGGLDIGQSNRPDLVLRYLGRFPGP